MKRFLLYIIFSIGLLGPLSNFTAEGKECIREINSGKGVGNTSGIINAETSMLKKASDSAFKIVRDKEKIFIKNKHLNLGKAGFAKFNTKNINVAKQWVQDAMRSKHVNFVPNKTRTDTFTAVIDMGKKIGTKGETKLKVVIDFEGQIRTAYPIK